MGDSRHLGSVPCRFASGQTASGFASILRTNLRLPFACLTQTTMNICLETSSYLPLIWCTPYSQSIISLIKSYNSEAEFYIQRDCIKEALSYVNYPNNWFRHAPIRLRKISKTITDKSLERLSFPSTAFQIILGGKMWSQGLYLNFVRHTAFLYADLVDRIDFIDKRKGMLELADSIDERYNHIKERIENHFKSDSFEFDLSSLFPYWGFYYLYADDSFKFKVKTWDVEELFEKGQARIRDVFHYESMLKSKIRFDKMLVANTGFSLHIKKQLGALPIEIVCAQSRQSEIFE